MWALDFLAEQERCKSSDHRNTASALEYRRVRHERKYTREYRPPARDLKVICDEFRQLVNGEEAISHNRKVATNGTDKPESLFSNESLQHLQTVMTDEHNNDEAFDLALFNALRGCLAGIYQSEVAGTNEIVLKSKNDNGNDDGDKYAVGFTRDAKAELDLSQPNQTDEESESSNSSSGRLGISHRSDYIVCLFERGSDDNDDDIKKKWQVKECFGTIGVRTNETNCAEFPISELNGEVRYVDLPFAHGALGQQLLFTMETIVPYYARNGIWEKNIPLALIAGRVKITDQTKRPKVADRLRWVHGQLHCPEVCGNLFTFSVDGYGHFHDKDTLHDSESADQAVRLLLDTILFGLKLAIRVHDMRNGGTIPLPCPASGRSVCIDDHKLDVSLCASPIKGAATAAYNSQGRPWKVYQGELFRGNVNFDEIIKPDFIDFRTDSEKTQYNNVLVKVSSAAVHRLLIDATSVRLALYYIKDGKKEMVEEIGSVLYGAVSTYTGLITFMADLSHEYKSLAPAENADHLPALWAGFATLVKGVLLPMAERSVIHPDLRPGYDVTYNILCKLEGEGAKKTAKLKLIDFESLVDVNSWTVPFVKDGPDRRFVESEMGWNATTYVWWQCVFIAYVWKERIKASDVAGVDGNDSVLALLQRVLVLKRSDSPGWLVDLRDHACSPKIDAASVESTLTMLGKLFV